MTFAIFHFQSVHALVSESNTAETHTKSIGMREGAAQKDMRFPEQ